MDPRKWLCTHASSFQEGPKSLQHTCLSMVLVQGNPPGRLRNGLIHMVYPHLGDPSKAVVAALVTAPINDVSVEIPHLDCCVPEGRHGDVRALKGLPCHPVLRPLHIRSRFKCWLAPINLTAAHQHGGAQRDAVRYNLILAVNTGHVLAASYMWQYSKVSSAKA